jgi:tRNA threonylcarbamoyladenosine biosynthesis protein TsaB
MRNLLAIDTSSEACSVALALNGASLQRHLLAPLQHAELLLPAVHSLLDEAGVTLASMDAIVFGRGPGSFTSLRIGIGVVQGLAWGANLPVVPISSLAAVAQQAIGRDPEDREDAAPRYILVAMDARMAEVFHCTYAVTSAGELLAESPESVSLPAAVRVTRAALTAGAGNGFGRYAELRRLGETLRCVQAELLPCAAALLPLARQWLARHEPLPAAAAQPLYIRNQVADKPSAADSAQAGVD